MWNLSFASSPFLLFFDYTSEQKNKKVYQNTDTVEKSCLNTINSTSVPNGAEYFVVVRFFRGGEGIVSLLTRFGTDALVLLCLTFLFWLFVIIQNNIYLGLFGGTHSHNICLFATCSLSCSHLFSVL